MDVSGLELGWSSFKEVILDLLRRDSTEYTIDQYKRILGYFCEYFDSNPDEILEKARRGEFSSKDFQRWIDHLNIELKRSPSTVRYYYYAVIKFFEVHGIKFNVILPKNRVKYDTRGFSREEILQLLQAAKSKRVEALILFLASTGVRRNVLKYLKIKHVPLLVKWLQDDKIESNEPVLVKVPSEASKNRTEYVTFMTPEAFKAITKYLKHRIRRRKEKITPESPLFASRFLTPLTEESLKQIFHRLARRAKIHLGGRVRYDVSACHSFRKFFRTQLDLARVPTAAAEQLMGHRAGLVGVYTKYTPEELKEQYLKAMPYLTIRERKAEVAEEVKKALLETWRSQAKLFGIDPMKIRIEKRREKGREITVEEEIKALQEAISKLIKPVRRREENLPNGGRRYEARIISEEDIVEYVELGWEIVKELRNGRIVVRREHD